MQKLESELLSKHKNFGKSECKEITESAKTVNVLQIFRPLLLIDIFFVSSDLTVVLAKLNFDQ